MSRTLAVGRIQAYCILFVAVWLAIPARTQTAPAAKIRLTPEQAITARRLRDLRWSPDGTRLAFTVTEPAKGSEQPKHIWVYVANSGELRQFTSSAKSESRPRWSPDSKKLAFLSDRSEEFQQIYVMPSDGGEAIRLTEGKRSINNFEWTPDGKQIAFLAPEPKSEAEERKEKDKDDAKSVDRDDKRVHLWLVDVASGKARELVGKPWEFDELQWTPRGDQLIVKATDHPESDQETNRIFAVNSADGKMQELVAPKGPVGGVRISPEGGEITYVGSRVDGPVPHDLYVLPISGGAVRNLTTQSVDRPIEADAWRPDGKLLALVDEGFRSKFFVVDTTGRAEPLPSPEMAVSDFALSNSGQVAFVGENGNRPQELWTWDGKSTPQSAAHFNQSFAQFALVAPEFVRYKSFDGRQIEGALVKPPGAEGKSKLPTVFLIHGGPTGNWSDEFDPWGQLLASAGYAVFYPNVRGSTGYGYDFMVLNRADWGGGDFKDVMAGVDYLVGRGIADPERLGIAGWSYGGYMAEWAITQTQRFKAAVSGAGLADLAAEFGTEDHPSYDEWFYGLPYEKPDGFRRSSPITYIKNARTPTLVLQGDADVIDPLGQSQQLYRALKRYGVETELVVYPREGHGLKEEKHVVDRLNRIVAWFDKHLK
jgi:dipeptidyl aminopeptidase/acylaminoacyl peptidase